MHAIILKDECTEAGVVGAEWGVESQSKWVDG